MRQRGIDRRGAAITLLVVSVCLVLLILLTTPWNPWGRHVAGAFGAPAPLTEDFAPAEIASSVAFQQVVRMPIYVASGVGLLAALWLGFTRVGARLSARILPRVSPWWARVLLGTFAVTLAVRIAVLPFDLWLELARRRSGVSTQSLGGWAADLAMTYAVTFLVTATLVLVMMALIRRYPRRWWMAGSAVAALTVMVGSSIYPVLVEPIYNQFTPMPAGQLRSSLLQLAQRDRVPVEDVLVADASRRTTRLNAYVSGFGPTRRIVVYDTLLAEATPGQVQLIVAHELGHAKHGDVLRGTVVGAVGAGAAVIALALLLDTAWIRRRAGVRSAADPRVVALVLALTALGVQVSMPLQNMISRRVEARADVHALDLSHDPTGYAQTQRWLAVANRSDLTPAPVWFALFSTHPTAPQRIALARSWSHRQGLPRIPAMAAR
ncbi:M48 family metallopeptidase [Actinopolymorpha pittospori]